MLPLKPLTQAMKGLAKFGPDGLVFAVIIIGTFGAIAAKADPIWCVLAGCLFCILWLVRNFIDAHLDVKRKMAALQIKAQTQALKLTEKFNLKPAIPSPAPSPAPASPRHKSLPAPAVPPGNSQPEK
ncbi:hypothetical protein Q8W71_17515 [Methylobacterium sp. NEAU 140]|uniref:hypothetical protein n=1 Tax=Methylobacterium sp. NEAU 140 TaxID=3064945 RepID=UPI0027330F11|nr:hypothetical protein [Methylobacterium sp. NEAU 140]MDP4024426.1 hypothetical protein [Methylobacterium sp. NEAU 140]